MNQTYTITSLTFQVSKIGLTFLAQLVSILMELRNRMSPIIRLWSLFCSIRVYTSLHFLPILLENWFFIILRFLSFLPVMCRVWCNLHKHINIFTIFVCIGVT